MISFRFKSQDWDKIYETLLEAPDTAHWKKKYIRKLLEDALDRWRRFDRNRSRESHMTWLKALGAADDLAEALEGLRKIASSSEDGAALIEDRFSTQIDLFERQIQNWKRRIFGTTPYRQNHHRDLLLYSLMECWESMGGRVGYSRSGGKFMRFLAAVMDSLKIDLPPETARWAIRKHQGELANRRGADSYDDALRPIE
jgi:hypothetical protein